MITHSKVHTRLKGATLRAFARICNLNGFQVDIPILHVLKRIKLIFCINSSSSNTYSTFIIKKSQNIQQNNNHRKRSNNQQSYYVTTRFILCFSSRSTISLCSVPSSSSLLFCLLKQYNQLQLEVNLHILQIIVHL